MEKKKEKKTTYKIVAKKKCWIIMGVVSLLLIGLITITSMGNPEETKVEKVELIEAPQEAQEEQKIAYIEEQKETLNNVTITLEEQMANMVINWMWIGVIVALTPTIVRFLNRLLGFKSLEKL